jgi:hypothetical protein
MDARFCKRDMALSAVFTGVYLLPPGSTQAQSSINIYFHVVLIAVVNQTYRHVGLFFLI